MIKRYIFVVQRRTNRYTRTVTFFPYTTPFRSCERMHQHHGLFVGALLGKGEKETDVLAGETAMSPGILCKQFLDADTHHLGSMQVQRAPSRRGSQRDRKSVV